MKPQKSSGDKLESSKKRRSSRRKLKLSSSAHEQEGELQALKDEIELIKAQLAPLTTPRGQEWESSLSGTESSETAAPSSWKHLSTRPRANTGRAMRKLEERRMKELKGGAGDARLRKTLSHEDFSFMKPSRGGSRNSAGSPSLHHTAPMMTLESVAEEPGGDEDDFLEGASRDLMARRIRELEDEVCALHKRAKHGEKKAKERKLACKSLAERNSFLVGELKLSEKRVYSALRDKSDQTKLLMDAKRTLKMEKIKNTQLKTWNQHLEAEVNLLRRDLDTMTRGVTTLIHSNEQLKEDLRERESAGDRVSRALFIKAAKAVREALMEDLSSHNITSASSQEASAAIDAALDPSLDSNRILELECELDLTRKSKVRHKRRYGELQGKHERLERLVANFTQSYAEEFEDNARSIVTENVPPPPEEAGGTRRRRQEKRHKERRPSAGQRLNELQRLVVQNTIKRVSPASSPASSRGNSPRDVSTSTSTSTSTPRTSPRAPAIPALQDEQSSPSDESPRARRIFYPISMEDAEEGDDDEEGGGASVESSSLSLSSDLARRVIDIRNETSLSPRTPSIPPGGESTTNDTRQLVKPLRIERDDGSDEERKKVHRRRKFVVPSVRDSQPWPAGSGEEEVAAPLVSPRTPAIPDTYAEPPLGGAPEASPRRVLPLKMDESDEDDSERLEIEL